MGRQTKTIISASRRTDIPAYYADWFRKRLEIGFTVYPNPHPLSRKPIYQKLSPEFVKAFVFWTRNPKPLIKHLDYIDKHYGNHHYMHFTINGLPEELESRNPKVDFAIESAKYLADRYGPGYVQWRFDPIVISSVTPEDYIYNKFDEIACKIQGATERCYFSFVDLYVKTKRNFKKLSLKENIEFFTQSHKRQILITQKLKSIADNYNIEMYACAEDEMLSIAGIKKAHCVDRDIINRICDKDDVKNYSDVPSRIGCGCIDSRDIGYYDSCPHGCIYCYSNRDPEVALENAKKYQKEGFTLDNEEMTKDVDDKQQNLQFNR